MKTLAESRAAQLRNDSLFPMPNAGVYDPQSIGGTHVLYVLHDITRPELYGGLPANPQIPFSFALWKYAAKPFGLAIALLSLVGVFFHYIFTGPKLPQPEPPAREEEL
jgi:formate dehydrogenase iron-sulfur subunit